MVDDHKKKNVDFKWIVCVFVEFGQYKHKSMQSEWETYGWKQPELKSNGISNKAEIKQN